MKIKGISQIRRAVTAPVKIYKKILSPLLGQRCRFYPTCSEYAIEAIEKFGVFKGGGMAIKRILRCNPFGGFGYDPVPEKEKPARLFSYRKKKS